MAKQNRKQKSEEYAKKYSDIPISYEERLAWMVDHYKLSTNKMDEIVEVRSRVLDNLYYIDYLI